MTTCIGNAFRIEKKIRFQHCDPAEIVFYPQYFVLFHELIEDWFTIGLNTDYARFVSEQRLGVPTVRIECEFLRPSKMGDLLDLRLLVQRLGSSSLSLEISAYSGDELRVRVHQVVVLFSMDSRQPVPIPSTLRAQMMHFAVPATDASQMTAK